MTAASGKIVYSSVGYIATIPLSGLDYQSQHQVYVDVTDKLMQVSKSVPVDRGIPIAHWGENDLCIERMLFARAGQTAVMNTETTRYYSESDSDESALEAWLDGHLAEMPECSARQLVIACYPAISGPRICGTLYRDYSTNNAMFWGASYGGYGTIYVKSKLSGTWYATKKLALS